MGSNEVSPVSRKVTGPGAVTPSLGVTATARPPLDGAKKGPPGATATFANPVWIWSGWTVVDSAMPKTPTVAVTPGWTSGATSTVMVTSTVAFGASESSGTRQVDASTGLQVVGALADMAKPTAARRNPDAAGATSTDCTETPAGRVMSNGTSGPESC